MSKIEKVYITENPDSTQKDIARSLRKILKRLEDMDEPKPGRKAFWNGDTLGEPWWPGKYR